MMIILNRILIGRQTPDLVFEYEDLQSILVSQISPADDNQFITVLFDLDTYIQEKERKKIIEKTEFRKLPLGKDPILIDDIKLRIIEDLKKQRKRGGLSSITEDNKIVQEILFVDNFFLTSKGKDISQLYPQLIGVKKKKHKKKNDDMEEEMELGDGNGHGHDHMAQEEYKYGTDGRPLSQEELEEKQMKMVKY